MRNLSLNALWLSLMLSCLCACGSPFLSGSGTYAVKPQIPATAARLATLEPTVSRVSGVRHPFGRALILQGSGFQTALHLGIYDALVEMNRAPDIVVSTCGGSVAAAFIRAYPDRQERMRVLLGVDFHAYLRAIAPTDRMPPSLLFTGAWSDAFTSSLLPAIGLGPLAQADLDLDRPNRALGAPSFLVVTGQAREGSPAPFPRFRETYFTDRDTARYLQNRESTIGRDYPNSRVDVETLTETPDAATAGRVFLASIADPLLFPPVSIQDRHYVTGAINLHPLELARDLADDVTLIYPNEFDTLVESQVFERFFGYDPNVRAQAVRDQDANHWVDLTDVSTRYKSLDLNPHVTLTGAVQSGVPATWREYRERVRELYRLGYERGMEAMQLAPRNSKAIVRVKPKPSLLTTQVRPDRTD